MTYAVIFLRLFLKQFRNIPRDVKNRITVPIEELAENPYLGLRLVPALSITKPIMAESNAATTSLACSLTRLMVAGKKCMLMAMRIIPT